MESSARKRRSKTIGLAVVKQRPPKRTAVFLVVGIGASAGGLEAFSELLHNLPEKTGMAFVLVQHLDPTHESALPEILGRTTKLPVEEVSDGQHEHGDLERSIAAQRQGGGARSTHAHRQFLSFVG